MSWLSWVVFGGLAGWVASLVLRDKQRGCLTNIVTGILGAVIAGFIYQWVTGLPWNYGWNWTSGLETGIRLIQFVWIDALLSAALAAPDSQASQSTAGVQSTELRSTLARLRAGVLLPHLWFTWRDRSFGSSANNHLIGELSGLVLALARWPTLTTWAAPLDRIQPLWERQVLTQFTPDGGNR